jgi:hypothetical protein
LFFIGYSAPDLLVGSKVDSKPAPVPGIAIFRLQYSAAAIAMVQSKTKRTESVQPKLENGDHRLGDSLRSTFALTSL